MLWFYWRDFEIWKWNRDFVYKNRNVRKVEGVGSFEVIVLVGGKRMFSFWLYLFLDVEEVIY